MPFRQSIEEGNILDTLKYMGMILFYLAVTVTVKAFVYVGMVKFYKCVKERYFPDEKEEEDKTLFDYESDWEDDEDGEHKLRVVEPKDGEDESTNANDNNNGERLAADFNMETDELLISLRERNPYKPMTEADFEKLKLSCDAAVAARNVDSNSAKRTHLKKS